MRLFLTLFAVLFFLNCEDETYYPPPEDLLVESVYLQVLTEMQLFNALIQSADSVVNSDSLRGALFEHYHVTEDQFLDSHAFYQSQPMQQKVRLDSVSNRLKRTLDILNEHRVSTNSSTDNSPVFQ